MTREELEEYRVLKVELKHTAADEDKEKIEARIRNIARYIDNIGDAVTRTIFKAVFIEGLSQARIANEINYSQAAVSKKISDYLKEE